MQNRFPVLPLDEEEADLIESVERLTERPKSMLTPESRAEIEAMAHATANGERQEISVQVSSHDLELLKLRAQREGVSYNALVSALIHNYVSR